MREKIEGENERNEAPHFPPQFSPSSTPGIALNTQVQDELKVGKLYFHNNSTILGFLRKSVNLQYEVL